MSNDDIDIDDLIYHPVTVDRRTLHAAYAQAERSQLAANDAVRKAEQMLREAKQAQFDAALTVSTLVQIMQTLP